MFKNVSPFMLYFISLICFGVANVVHKQELLLYNTLLGLGILFCFLGFYKRFKKR